MRASSRKSRMTQSSKPLGQVKWGTGPERNVLVLRFFYPPVPASRPRVSKWGVYYGKTYKAYMKAAEDAIPQASEPFTVGNLMVDIEFVCDLPKATKRLCPRGDIDNYVKAILDAITKKGYWHDDDQVVVLTAVKRWCTSGEDPHTTVKIQRA